MSWKDLLFEKVEDGNTPKETPKVEEVKQAPTGTIYFPQSTPSSFSTPTVTSVGSNCEPHMSKILEKYETGFNSLNQPGYDFFEFFQSVMKIDPRNPQVYDMAFTMGNSMDPTLTKEKLVSQAKFYLDEIGKVHTNFKTEGEAKKESINANKSSEGSSLVSQVEILKIDLEKITRELSDKESQLSTLDVKYTPQLVEIDCKLQANDLAKDKLISSIEMVRDNIK